MSKWLITAMTLMLSVGVDAMQEFRVKDGDKVKVKISRNDLTRIAVAGSGRLDKVWGAAGMLEIQPEVDTGEVFVRPLPGSKPVVSFFVRDDLGNTYTIEAQQYETLSAETIMLKPASPALSEVQQRHYRSKPHVDRVKRLMKGMAIGDDIDGYTWDDVNELVPIWKETRIELRRLYSGYDLVGEVYVIKNQTREEMTFHESEFMDFGEHVQAVALERLTLQGEEATYLYIVRATEG